MFENLVMGADIQPARMLVTLNVSNSWSLLYALRAIIAGWIFQINTDVTFGVCRHAVDLLSMGINSMQHRNYSACYCIIQSKCESENVYTGCFLQMQQAVHSLMDATDRGKKNCTSCAKLLTPKQS